MANQGKTPSWKTDVNRHPTKKWAVAPSYNYDGDDWDGYDEFDNYASAPASKPTGFRQKGQVLNPAAIGSRNFTMPESSNTGAALPRDRANSYEIGDERRLMPSASTHGPSLSLDTAGAFSGHPILPQSERTPQPTTAGPHNVQNMVGAGDVDVSPSVYSSVTSSSHTFSPQDYTPFPDPQGMPQNLSSIEENHPDEEQLPHRESSRSQRTNLVAPGAAELEAPAFRDLSQSRSFDTGSEISATEHAATPVAFIRPADIYKRIEIEREKERRSSESSRPSTDSAGERFRRTSIPHQPSSSPMRQVTTVSDEAITTATSSINNSQPSNEPGLENIHQPVLPPSNDINVDKSDALVSQNPVPVKIVTNAKSDPPTLPNVTRFSGFGIEPDTWQSPANSNMARLNTSPISQEPGSVLQHQPSLGFRSVVHQAFDQENDRLTPLSASAFGSQRSVEGSEVSILGTNSTDGISPIMSHVPSGSMNAFAKSQHDSTNLLQPSIAEEDMPSNSSRPDSSSTLRGPVIGASSQTPSHSPNVSIDSSVTPGYRRQMSPPNTKENPAGSAAVQSYHDVQEPASAEMTQPSEVLPQPENPNDYTVQDANATTMSEMATDSEARGREMDASVHSPTADDKFAVKSPSRRSSTSWASSRHRSQSPHKLDHPDEHYQDAQTEHPHETSGEEPEAGLSHNTNDEIASANPTGAYALAAGTGAVLAASAIGSAAVMSQSSKDVQDIDSSSIPSDLPPPPPAKDTPIRSASENAAEYFPTSPSQAETDTSEHENESDKLRHDIIASLTPKDSKFQPARPLSPLIPQPSTLQGDQQGDGRTSTLFPSEYESYWADGQEPEELPAGHENQRFSKEVPPNHDEEDDGYGVETSQPRQLADEMPTSGPHPGGFERRFSWEMDDEEENTESNQDIQANQGARDFGSHVGNDNFGTNDLSSNAPKVAELESTHPHPITTDEGDNFGDVNAPLGIGGLYVSPNSNELADANQSSISSLSNIQSAQYENRTSTDQPDGFGVSPVRAFGPPLTAGSPITQHSPTTAKRMSQAKPVGFKEIVALKHPQDRINGYNQTRVIFAETDTGLENWLSYMKSQDPTLGDSFKKSTRSDSMTIGASSSKQQFPQGKAPGIQGESSNSPQGPIRSMTIGGRSSSAQMSAKGKDLLHSAGILSGKASHGAKGLFAKGKSKFRSASGSEKTQKRVVEAPPMPHPLSTSQRAQMPPVVPAPASKVDPEQRQMPSYPPEPRLQTAQSQVPQLPPAPVLAPMTGFQNVQNITANSTNEPQIQFSHTSSPPGQPHSLTAAVPSEQKGAFQGSKPLAAEEAATRDLSSPHSSGIKRTSYEPLQLPVFPDSPRDSFSSAVSRQLNIEHPQFDAVQHREPISEIQNTPALRSDRNAETEPRDILQSSNHDLTPTTAVVGGSGIDHDPNEESWEMIDAPEASEFDAQTVDQDVGNAETLPKLTDDQAVSDPDLHKNLPSADLSGDLSGDVQPTFPTNVYSNTTKLKNVPDDSPGIVQDFHAPDQPEGTVSNNVTNKQPQASGPVANNNVTTLENSQSEFGQPPLREQPDFRPAGPSNQSYAYPGPQASNRMSSSYSKGNDNSWTSRDKDLPPVPIMPFGGMVDPIDPRRQGTEYQIPGVGPPPAVKSESSPKTRSWHRFRSRKGSSTDDKQKSKEARKSQIMPEAAMQAEPSQIGHRATSSKGSSTKVPLQPSQTFPTNPIPRETKRASTLPANVSDIPTRPVGRPSSQSQLPSTSRPGSKGLAEASDTPEKKKRLSGISFNSLFGSKYLASTYNPNEPPFQTNTLSKPDPGSVPFGNAQPRGRRATTGTDVRNTNASSGSRPRSFHPLDHPESKYFPQGLAHTATSSRASSEMQSRRGLNRQSSSAVRTSSAPANARIQGPSRGSIIDDKRRSHIEYLQSQEIFPVRPASKAWDQFPPSAAAFETMGPRQRRANSNDATNWRNSNVMNAENVHPALRQASTVPFSQVRDSKPPQSWGSQSEMDPRSSYQQMEQPPPPPPHQPQPQQQSYSAFPSRSSYSAQDAYPSRQTQPSQPSSAPRVPPHSQAQPTVQTQTKPLSQPPETSPMRTKETPPIVAAFSTPTRPKTQTTSPSPVATTGDITTISPTIPAVPITSLPPSVRKSAGRVANPEAPPAQPNGTPTRQPHTPQTPQMSQTSQTASQSVPSQSPLNQQPSPAPLQAPQSSTPIETPAPNPAPNLTASPNSNSSPSSQTKFPPRHSSKQALALATTARALPPLNTTVAGKSAVEGANPDDYIDADDEPAALNSGSTHPRSADLAAAPDTAANKNAAAAIASTSPPTTTANNNNKNDDDDDDEVVMSPTSWPGQEWVPREFAATPVPVPVPAEKKLVAPTTTSTGTGNGTGTAYGPPATAAAAAAPPAPPAVAAAPSSSSSAAAAGAYVLEERYYYR